MVVPIFSMPSVEIPSDPADNVKFLATLAPAKLPMFMMPPVPLTLMTLAVIVCAEPPSVTVPEVSDRPLAVFEVSVSTRGADMENVTVPLLIDSELCDWLRLSTTVVVVA